MRVCLEDRARVQSARDAMSRGMMPQNFDRGSLILSGSARDQKGYYPAPRPLVQQVHGLHSGGMVVSGTFAWKAYKTLKSGRKVQFWEENTRNTVTNDGKGGYFISFVQGLWSSGTPPGATGVWVGLINNSPAPTLFPLTDTLASHAGWTEIAYNSGSGYTNTTRIAWTADHNPISSGNGLTYGSSPAVNISNTNSPASFTVGGSNITVYGGFIAIDAVYGTVHTVASTGTSGLLFCETALSSPVTFNSTTTITAVYTFTIS